ncbi:MAG TPA: hypothetical protein VEP89_14855, partial [Draconibacterium sp.]|nr:hypothetical protein [Draconibacterium sp.]
INTLLKTECKENTFLENNQAVTSIFAKTINNYLLASIKSVYLSIFSGANIFYFLYRQKKLSQR